MVSNLGGVKTAVDTMKEIADDIPPVAATTITAPAGVVANVDHIKLGIGDAVGVAHIDVDADDVKKVAVDVVKEVEGGKTTEPFDIVNYGDKTPGLENHHGVLDVWATNNIDGYVSRASNSTTIALTKEQHATTKSVYRDWLFEKTGKKVGGKVDWKRKFLGA